MRKIVISGYYGFGNAGDEAMLSAILEAIKNVMPHSEVTVISGDPLETQRKHGVQAVARLAPWAIITALRECDLLISGGGSLLQDVTSKRSLYYYLAIIRMAKMLGKPVMLYAQGIGPIQRTSARKAVGMILNGVDLITVRDERSREELQELGVTSPPIHVTADAVLSMHPVDVSLASRLLQDCHIKGTESLIGVSVRSWKQDRQYREALAQALDRLVEEQSAHVVFVPMQHPDDTKEAESIVALMRMPASVLRATYTTTELLALSGRMDIMIGIRLHALVFASLMEKPVIGISYDPKIDNFLGMIGKTAIGRLDALDGNVLYEEAVRLLQTPDYTARERVRHLREASLANAHMALALLEQQHTL